MVRAKDLALACVILAPTALTADERCTPNNIGFDVCEQAAELQAEMAPDLPQKLSSELTLVSIAALGRHLVFNIRWDMTQSELQALMAANAVSLADMRTALETGAQSLLCTGDLTAAFIGLGGIVVQNYTTEDAFGVHNLSVESCPES